MDNTSAVTRKIGFQKLPDGTEIILCGFGLVDWSALQEAALSHYKRTMIKTVTDTLDLFEDRELRNEQLRRVYDEAKRLTIADIPGRVMPMPKTNGDGKELKDKYGNIQMHDVDVDYMTWWMSETLDGKLHALWLSARKAPSQSDWSKQYISDLFEQATDSVDEITALEIEQAAQTVGRLSQSELAANFTEPSQKTSEGTPTMVR